MEYRHNSEEPPHVQTDARNDLKPSKFSSFGLEDLTLPFGFVRKLGSGGHGQVDEVFDLSSGQHLVRKSVLRKRVDVRGSSPMKHLKNELAVLKKLNHPNLVKLIGAYTDSTNCHLIMQPVADQNLDDFMRSSPGSSRGQPNCTVGWIQDLCSALLYLHSCGVKHLDIKPQNILIKGDHILLADFGTAKSILSSEINGPEKVAVTPMYCAPETIRYGQLDYTADIFSLGCVVSEMITFYSQRSIQDFEDFRAEDQIKAFHLTIPMSKAWLQELAVPECPAQSVVQFLIPNVIEMLDERPENRPKAFDLQYIFAKLPPRSSLAPDVVECRNASGLRPQDASRSPGEVIELSGPTAQSALPQESSDLQKGNCQESKSPQAHYSPLEGLLDGYRATDDFHEHRVTQNKHAEKTRNASFAEQHCSKSPTSNPVNHAWSVSYFNSVPSLSIGSSLAETSGPYDPSTEGDRTYLSGTPIFGDLNLHPPVLMDYSYGREDTDDFPSYPKLFPYEFDDPSVLHGEYSSASQSYPNPWRIPSHFNSSAIHPSSSLYPSLQLPELSHSAASSSCSWHSYEATHEKGCCPYPECGKVFKDLKAHMLTHQMQRPEKCPIQTCDYHSKGFARKYDKNRHTLTHYKGVMVCGFCPGSGSGM
jgi:serine/threonine protein kinase